MTDTTARDRRRYLREKIEKYNSDSRNKYELQWFHSYVVEGLLNDCDKLEERNSNLQSIANELSEDLKLALTQYEGSYNRLAQEQDKLKLALKELLEIDPIKAVHLKGDDFWLECLYCAEEIHCLLSFYDDKLHDKDCPYIRAKKVLEGLND